MSNSPGIPYAQTVHDNLSQGIQTSPVMEASPVQHIQDVYGSPSCGEDLTQHKNEEKVPFWEKEDNVKPEFSQYSRYSQPTDSDRNSANVEETSIWRPFVVRESNTREVNPSLGRRGSVNIEGTRLASYRQGTHMTPPQESVRTNRGYRNSVDVSSGTFIPCRERFYPSRQGNLVNRSSGNGLGYRRGFDCTGYVVEDPLLDPCVEFEGQGPGGHNGDFVVQGQSPSNYGVRDRNTVERETNKHPVGLNPSGLGVIESHVPQGTGFVSNPCQTDTETSPNEKLPHRKQKEPDKYDGEKVEWQDFRVHFETVATWNGWTNFEKGLQLATCLRGKAQKVLSELKPSQKSDYHTLTTVLAERFNPPPNGLWLRGVTPCVKSIS